MTVRLEPLGTLTGRILDSAGRPRAGLNVPTMLSNQASDYQNLPMEVLVDPVWGRAFDREAMTDAEVRFRVASSASISKGPGLQQRI